MVERHDAHGDGKDSGHVIVVPGLDRIDALPPSWGTRLTTMRCGPMFRRRIARSPSRGKGVDQTPGDGVLSPHKRDSKNQGVKLEASGESLKLFWYLITCP